MILNQKVFDALNKKSEQIFGKERYPYITGKGVYSINIHGPSGTLILVTDMSKKTAYLMLRSMINAVRIYKQNKEKE